jgi:lipoate-protein ligase A
MPKKKLTPYDVTSKLIETEWPVSRLAKYFKITEKTIRNKLQEYLCQLQAEITDLEGDEQTIEEALKK